VCIIVVVEPNELQSNPRGLLHIFNVVKMRKVSSPITNYYIDPINSDIMIAYIKYWIALRIFIALKIRNRSPYLILRK